MLSTVNDSILQNADYHKHSIISDLKIEMSEHDISAGPGSPSIIRGMYRRIRRLLKGSNRRQLVITSLFLVLVVVMFQSYKHLPPYGTWSPPDIFACSTARSNPHSILPPPKPDTERLGKIWITLHDLFDAHPPTPSSLPRTIFSSGDNIDNFPPLEVVRDHLNLSEAEVHATRIAHTEVVRNIAPYPLDLFSGRGVVMLAGGHYSEFAATGLGMLREVGSKLPVEVWMKDSTEEKEGWCDELKKEGMACRKLSDYMDMSALKHPYAWKIFTMLFSSFKELMFLDADNMPLKNPDYLFDMEKYRSTGVILWPDYWKNTGSPWLPYVVGISDERSDVLLTRTLKTVESGQLVWDKQRHWRSLCLAAYYNYYGPDYYYTLITQAWSGWGDKDTFLTALEALKENYYEVPHDLTTLFLNGTVHGIGMIQADPANETARTGLFLHSNMIKWSVRDFLCVGCPSNSRDSAPSFLEDPDSIVNSHLKEGKRIFLTNQLAELGLDPEPVLWKCMEYTACRSVWGNDQLCKETRDHMAKTFGFKFKPSRVATVTGYGELMCVVDP